MMIRCFKIKEKVSLNIASEASYVYILSNSVTRMVISTKGQNWWEKSNETFWVIFKHCVMKWGPQAAIFIHQRHCQAIVQNSIVDSHVDCFPRHFCQIFTTSLTLELILQATHMTSTRHAK